MAKKPKVEKFTCRFCKQAYVRETSLINHACEKKRRWHNQDKRSNQIGFMAWLEFMNSIVGTGNNTEHTYEKFINSRLYLPFVRFGSHLMDLNAVNNLEYVQFLIKSNVKVADWIKEYPYQAYVQTLNAKETPDHAIKRCLYLAEEWSIDNNTSMDKFFEDISPNRALHWIATGRISPWFIFASSKSHFLLSKFTPAQQEQMDKYINRATWKVKIKKFREEFDNIHKILKEHNL